MRQASRKASDGRGKRRCSIFFQGRVLNRPAHMEVKVSDEQSASQGFAPPIHDEEA